MIRENFNKLIKSIAFYPALIALGFLLLSYFSIAFDFSESGQHIRSNLKWLKLQDPSTARSIISSIAAGIISLTVFSFSMVMIVLNQTASQMSNRILDNLIGSRYQQMVLGIYVGTIVFALFLLSSIRDIDSGLQIPVLSTYLLMLLTVLDVFLFIYFLHYITQSVKYEVIIRRIYKETREALEQSCISNTEPAEIFHSVSDHIINSQCPGIYEGFNKNSFISICEKNECMLYLIHTPGTFILKGMPVIKSNKELPETLKTELINSLYIHESESIKNNFYFGCRQLTEVAVKALSPGINDPATAVSSLRALFELYLYRASNYPETYIRTESDKAGIILKELTFEKIFTATLLPIWDYGKDDRMIREEMHHLLINLKSLTGKTVISDIIKKVENKF
ncbi:MAG TPA: DUF2254 family protein [Ignavibacteria bacterium]|nr:DUF2254 family protein [Ignavibacteria bacterium]